MDSAILGLPDDRETALGLEADHSGLCRFADEHGLDYRPVWKSIKSLVMRSLEKAQELAALNELRAPDGMVAQMEIFGGLAGE